MLQISVLLHMLSYTCSFRSITVIVLGYFLITFLIRVVSKEGRIVACSMSYQNNAFKIFLSFFKVSGFSVPSFHSLLYFLSINRRAYGKAKLSEIIGVMRFWSLRLIIYSRHYLSLATELFC